MVVRRSCYGVGGKHRSCDALGEFALLVVHPGIDRCGLGEASVEQYARGPGYRSIPRIPRAPGVAGAPGIPRAPGVAAAPGKALGPRISRAPRIAI
jgi:hypothetical protein